MEVKWGRGVGRRGEGGGREDKKYDRDGQGIL